MGPPTCVGGWEGGGDSYFQPKIRKLSHILSPAQITGGGGGGWDGDPQKENRSKCSGETPKHRDFKGNGPVGGGGMRHANRFSKRKWT